MSTSTPVVVSRPKASPMPRPSMKLCTREPGRSQHAHLFVRAGLLRLVAVMEDDQPLGEEEQEESCADERADAGRVSDRVDRFGQNVEESHSEDDAAGQCDQGRELAVKA